MKQRLFDGEVIIHESKGSELSELDLDLDQDQDQDPHATIDKLQSVDEDVIALSDSQGCPQAMHFPWGVMGFIFGNEIGERFSFYAMRALLVLYLNLQLGFEVSDSIAIYGYFLALVYFTPLIGGYISDSYWGKYTTILILSMVYIWGGCMLAGFAGLKSVGGTFVALILISIGTGGIKPCVSSFGADQLVSNYQKEHHTSKYFSIFYLVISSGSLASYIFSPIIKEHYGYQTAFSLPAVLLVIATVICWLGRNRYVMVAPTGSILKPFVQTLLAASSHWWEVRVLGRADSRVEENLVLTVRTARPGYVLLENSQGEKVNIDVASWLDFAKLDVDAQVVDDIKQSMLILPLWFPSLSSLLSLTSRALHGSSS
eukprot:TRINITY_DN2727_c0_g2_i2.p1 TRINITY_DN2727_c0_g2~~TRINITY_DN2727_c0_g2_i2.p1  ORF type:complete len:372 (-),score=72.13 TRINITY_DN2727_c0_g2_i2:406-1521(-)